MMFLKDPHIIFQYHHLPLVITQATSCIMNVMKGMKLLLRQPTSCVWTKTGQRPLQNVRVGLIYMPSQQAQNIYI